MSHPKRGVIILGPGNGTSGPSAGGSTDNAVARWDGTTGKLLQNSTVIISDTGNITFGTAGSILSGTTGSQGITATGTNQSFAITPSGTGMLSVPNAGVGTQQQVMSLLMAGQPANGTYGNGAYWNFGQAASLNNSAVFQFAYTGAGLAANAIGMSVFGNSNGLWLTGNGHLLLGGLTTDGTGVLQFPAATTSAGGIAFGTDVTFYRNGANSMTLAGSGLTIDSSRFLNFGSGNRITDSGGFVFQTNNTTALILTSGQAMQLAGLITSYNGIVTAGNGVSTVQASGRATAQGAANASVSTYTVGGSDASFRVSANVLVTTATTHSFSVTCTYTDEGNVSRTLTLGFTQLSGATLVTLITNITGAGPYESLQYHIRCKASTAITFATTGTFTTVVYNAEGVVTKVA